MYTHFVFVVCIHIHIFISTTNVLSKFAVTACSVVAFLGDGYFLHFHEEHNVSREKARKRCGKNY